MPQPELLETFPNPYASRDYEIFMTTSEFTSMCPLGGVESDAAELALQVRHRSNGEFRFSEAPGTRTTAGRGTHRLNCVSL